MPRDDPYVPDMRSILLNRKLEEYIWDLDSPQSEDAVFDEEDDAQRMTIQELLAFISTAALLYTPAVECATQSPADILGGTDHGGSAFIQSSASAFFLAPLSTTVKKSGSRLMMAM